MYAIVTGVCSICRSFVYSESKILVTIDGSKPSIDAAESAISLAKSYDAKLMALYVIVPDASFSESSGYHSSFH